MICFPDTSFLCSLYRAQDYSPIADAYMKNLAGNLWVTSLLLLEFRQSVRLQIRLNTTDRSKGFTKYEGQQMLQDLQEDLNSGLLALLPVDWPEVHQRAESLSNLYTMTNGHRIMDIMHVATALQIGAKEFLTFDSNQRKLAEAEGLIVPLIS